jgi:hypothetical protein
MLEGSGHHRLILPINALVEEITGRSGRCRLCGELIASAGLPISAALIWLFLRAARIPRSSEPALQEPCRVGIPSENGISGNWLSAATAGHDRVPTITPHILLLAYIKLYARKADSFAEETTKWTQQESCRRSTKKLRGSLLPAIF